MSLLAPLFLVVGPSGAGKDSLLAGAGARLAGDSLVHFARRIITRPADATEDNDQFSPGEFDRTEAKGGFLLSWRAHGLAYGLAAELQERRRQGVTVVANVSRAVIATARRDLAPVRIVMVTAPPALLAQRLAARGRESAETIAGRLARADLAVPFGDDVSVIVNDGPLAAAIDRLVALLRGQ